MEYENSQTGFTTSNDCDHHHVVSDSVFEELFTQVESAVQESDDAVETVVESFMKMHIAASSLVQSETLAESDRELAQEVCDEVPKAISALQFQDRLRQRLSLVKSMLTNMQISRGFGYRHDSSRVEAELSQGASHLSENWEGESITLFTEAA